jgi:nucleoside-diphosphate-sugar epimerase
MTFDIKTKKCLVTGASGLIGQRVSLGLLRENVRVRAFVRSREKASLLEKSGAEIYTGDMTNADSVKKSVLGCEVVFHFAGVLNEFKPWSYYYQVNVEGTRILAEAALKAGVQRFIHASTVYVYGMKAGTGITEKSPHVRSGDPYSDTKLEGHAIIYQLYKNQGLPSIIIQPSEVYGPGDQTWTLRPFQMIRNGRMILVNKGKGLIQPIFVEDLVEGVLAAARKGCIGETYILCGSEVVTFNKYFGYYTRMLKKKSPPSVPAWMALSLGALFEWMARISGRQPMITRQDARATLTKASYDGSKGQRELDFEAKTTLAEGMSKTELWLKGGKI